MTECLIMIACLIAGFLCGRMGSRAYDGLWLLGKEPGDSKIEMPLSEEEMLRCRYILLKVVKQKGETA